MKMLMRVYANAQLQQAPHHRAVSVKASGSKSVSSTDFVQKPSVQKRHSSSSIYAKRREGKSCPGGGG